MTLDDLWSDVRELTGKLSDVTRQAAYAGLAIIWIFKTGDAATYHLDRSLIWAGVLLALGLTLDLAQYACNAALRWFNARREEQIRGVDYEGQGPHAAQATQPHSLCALRAQGRAGRRRLCRAAHLSVAGIDGLSGAQLLGRRFESPDRVAIAQFAERIEDDPWNAQRSRFDRAADNRH